MSGRILFGKHCLGYDSVWFKKEEELVRLVVAIDLPTSRAQSFFFFFWKRDFGSVKPQKPEREGAGARPLRAGLPPEPEMRSKGRLRKSMVATICVFFLRERRNIITFL